VYMLMGASHFWVAGGFAGTRSVILAFVKKPARSVTTF